MKKSNQLNGSRISVTVFALAVLLCSTPLPLRAACSLSTPTLLNGGFESLPWSSGTPPSWTYYNRGGINQTITRQTASPPEGAAYLYIQCVNVADKGGVYQDITSCNPGSTYQITGSLRAPASTSISTVKCSSDTSVVYGSATLIKQQLGTSATTWQTFSGNVTATGTSMRLWLDAEVASGGGGNVGAFDNLVVTCVSDPTPTKLAYPSGGLPANPEQSDAFSVTVQAQDASGNPGPVTTATTVTLTKNGGSGSLSGTTSGVIAAGAASVTISGVIYNAADTITLTATASGGTPSLSPVTSGNLTFSLAFPPTKLVYTSVPSACAVGAFSVTVQAQDPTGSPASVTSATTITLTKASGAGTLSGTTTGIIPAGGNSVTISGAFYGSVSTMTLTATASGGAPALTAVTSGNIVFSGRTQPVRWAVGSADWDNGSSNWKDSAATPRTAAYLAGDAVQFEDGFSGTSPITVTIDGGGLPLSVTVNNQNKAYTIAGSDVINGSASLTKQGSGTLTLNSSVVHGFTGGLTLNGGTLVEDFANMTSGYANLINSGNTLALGGGSLLIEGNSGNNSSQQLGNVTVNSGGGKLLLDPNGTLRTTTLTLGAITANTAGSLLVGKAAGTSGTVTITSTSGTLANGIYSGRIVYTSDGGTTVDWATTASGGSPYSLSAYSGYTSLPTTATTSTTNYRMTAGVAPGQSDTVNTLKMENASGALTLAATTMTIGANGVLVTGTAAQSITGTAGATRLQGPSGGELVIHQYNTGGLTISAVIGNNTSATALTKSGSGTLTLSGANTYTGKTFINQGVLSISADSNLGASTAADGLTFNGGTLFVTTAPSASTTRGIYIGPAGGTIDVTTTSSALYIEAAIISGSGTLTVKGYSGLLGVSEVRSWGAANTFGKLVVDNALYTAGSSSAGGIDTSFGAAPTSFTPDAITLQNGGAIRLNTASLALVANRGITLGSGGGYIRGLLSGTINGIISGSGNLGINGNSGDVNTVTLNGANTFTGTTKIYYGTLSLGNNLALQNSIFDSSSAGTLSFVSGINTPTFGGITGSTAKTLPTTVTSLTLNPGIGQSPSYSGALGGGTGGTSMSVTKTGVGTQTLSGASLYAGGTTLNGGQLNINYGTSSDTTHSAIGVGTFTINGGTIDNTSGSAVTIGPTFTWNWNGSFNVGNSANLALRAGASVVLGADVTVNVNGSGLSPYFGVTAPISGSGRKLTKNGGGCMLLSSTTGNSYTGGTVLNAGTFGLYHANSLGTVAGTFTINGGTIHNYTSGLTLVNYPQIWGGDFTFDGGYDLNMGSGAVTLGGNRQVTVSANALTVGGVIDDGVNTYGLTKAGIGALVLGGASSYNGGTAVNAGTLEIGASGSIDGNVTVANGAVFKPGNAAAMESAASLTLNASPSAATVNLNFSGTQTIGALYFGATSKAQGTWGGTSSSATHKHAAFTGTGLLNITAGGASPTIVLTSITPNPVCAGSPVTLGATVSGGSSPSGSVEFFDGATSLGTAPLSGSSATLPGVTSLSAGAHNNVTAKYLGDDNNKQATSAAGSVTVNPSAATSAITGDNSAAINQAGKVYSVTLTSGSSYAWGVPGGASITAGGSGPNNNQVTVTFGSSSGNVTVTETTSAGCVGSQQTLAVTVGPNHAPTAENKSYSLGTGMSLKIAKADLLVGSGDVDSGDSVSYDAIVNTGSQGATVTENGTYVFYVPQAGNNNADTLQYRLKDTSNGTVTKNIAISVTDVSGQALGILVPASGPATVSFAGIPGYPYQAQRATDMNFGTGLRTWNTNAPGIGVFQIQDDFTDLGTRPSQAWYRLKYNP
jgi:fibronectin-binding autotransporter adhesin